MSKLDIIDGMELAIAPIESYLRILEHRSPEDIETASIGLILIDHARQELCRLAALLSL